MKNLEATGYFTSPACAAEMQGGRECATRPWILEPLATAKHVPRSCIEYCASRFEQWLPQVVRTWGSVDVTDDERHVLTLKPVEQRPVPTRRSCGPRTRRQSLAVPEEEAVGIKWLNVKPEEGRHFGVSSCPELLQLLGYKSVPTLDEVENRIASLF